MKHTSLASERRTTVIAGTAVTILGAAVLISGLANLAIDPAIAALGRRTPDDLPVPLSGLTDSMAIGVLITQNWPIGVTFQLAFSTIALAAGIAFLRWRSWARFIVEGLGWSGVAFLAVPVVWIARWVLATPADRVFGLRAGLETLPSGVGQPVATVLQLFVGGPAELGWWLLGQIGVVRPASATHVIFAWTPAGAFVGTVASIGIPAGSLILIALVRGWQMPDVLRRSAL